MSFEDIPEDKFECYPCSICEEGNLCETKPDYWECDNCGFVLNNQEEKKDATI